MTELYHQLGHRYKWSITSLLEEGTGDGVILAPRYIDVDDIVSLPSEVKRKAIFDPQFYIPDSQQGKLPGYGFFPEVITAGFRTSEWDPEIAEKSARSCLRFQVENDFRFAVIPTRFREGMPSDYVESQSALFVDPFLRASKDMGLPVPCLLQLILTDQMLKDGAYHRDLLNWVTGLREISGVYLIFYFPRYRKQVVDIDFLLAVDHFVKALKSSGMTVVLGYLNTESIPLMCSAPDIVTMGAYENLRIFSTTAFEEKEEDSKQRGPNARIYVSRLLQWIEYQYIGAIGRTVGNIDAYVDDSAHRLAMFQPTYRWHFTKPEPYKHYFVAFSRQFRRLASLQGAERNAAVKAEIEQAIAEHTNLEAQGIVMDADSAGGHLPAWLTFMTQRDN